MPLAEQPVGLRLQLRDAHPRQRRRRIGRARFAAQAFEGRNQRIERLRDVAFAAAKRRKASRRKPILQVGEVVRVVPNHVCVVVNMVDRLIAVRGDRIVDVLPVAARGRLA